MRGARGLVSVVLVLSVLLSFSGSLAAQAPVELRWDEDARTLQVTVGDAAAADLILYNGKVVTVDERFRIAEAVAIRDGRFLAVGSDEEVTAWAGPGTRLINLRGKTVIPGLFDSHLHLLGAARNLSLVDLSQARSIADVVRAIEERVRVSPPGAWIVASSAWHESQLREGRLPTRWDLDPISPENPVMIPRGGHVITTNSLALSLAGITRDTPTPEGGVIVRDPETGEPTGVLVEGPATSLVRRLVPQPTHAEDVEALREMMRELNSWGITTVTDPGQGREGIQAYLDLWRRKELTLRVNVLYRMRSLDDVAFATSTYGQGFGDDMLWIGGLKYGSDGGIEAAYLRDPYLIVEGEQTDPNFRGQLLLPPGGMPELVEAFRLAAQRGWQVHTHAVGDAAIDAVLDAYAQVDAEVPIEDLRWSIMHIFLPNEEAIQRMRAMGVVATVQDHPTSLGHNMKRYWGDERAAYGIPIRTLLDHGIVVGGGTDAPVVSWNPFVSMWWMVTRRTLNGDVLGPEQAITPREALQLYTIGSARAHFKENELGSIEPGKLADLVVLSDDLLTVPHDRIKDIRAEMTILGGIIVYDRDGDPSAP